MAAWFALRLDVLDEVEESRFTLFVISLAGHLDVPVGADLVDGGHQLAVVDEPAFEGVGVVDASIAQAIEIGLDHGPVVQHVANGDEAAGEPEEGYLLYDSKDLTTHAMCVGMTGSGKTGLCISLLEEAAIDGVPAIAIDPKGDLGNLMLTFEKLEGASFRPWVNEDDARKKGLSPDAFADAQAELWRNGLAKWGQSAERIAKLRASADFRIYTPGSNAGIPLSIMASFSAPPPELIEDGDLYRDRINTTVTSLLTLLGVDADPIQSPEHVMLSTILDHFWRQGTNLDLAGLIVALQKPPVDRIGVLDLESFYPAKERFKLAMRLNGLL